MCDEVFEITPKTSKSSTQIDLDTSEIEKSELTNFQEKLAKAEMSITTMTRECQNKNSTIKELKQALECKESENVKLTNDLANKASIIKTLQLSKEEEFTKVKYLLKENKEVVNLLESKLQSKEKDLKIMSDEIKNLNIQLEDQRKEIVEKLNLLNKLQNWERNDSKQLQTSTPAQDNAKLENNSNNSNRENLIDSTLIIDNGDLDTDGKITTITDKQTGKKVKAMTLGERIKQFSISQDNNERDDFTRSYTTPNRKSINPRRCQKFSDSNLITEVNVTDSNTNSSSVPLSPASPTNTTNVSSLKANISKRLITFNKFSNCTNIEKCTECGKTAYPVEKLIVDKLIYHKKCFKCSVCKTTLRPGKHAGYQGTIFCMNHFKQNFLVQGGKYPDQIRS